MKKFFFTVLAGALVAVSCNVVEPDMTFSGLKSNSIISIPMETEQVGLESEETKSYFSDSGSGWSFVWEDGDRLGFFQYRRGLFYNQGSAEVDKRPSSVKVNYPADDFKAGDAIWSYFMQPDVEAELGYYDVVNDDPDNLYMIIPTAQVTTSEPEEYNYVEDYSFQVNKVNTNGFKSYTIKNENNPVGTTPASGTLKFKIVGYDPSKIYRTGANTSNLSIDYYGNASVDVAFDPVTKNGTKYTSTTDVDIFIEGYEEYKATIPVTCSVSVKEKISIIVIDLRGASMTYSYSAGAPSGASVVLEFSEQGDIKPYPVRDCMPCASKQTAITSSHIQYPEDIQSSMTMYMLGSVVEFRAYTLDETIAAGETLYGVIFQSTSGNCAGLCTYDLKGETLALENFTDSEILAFDNDGLEVKYGKDNYVPLYMTIAPGNFAATVSFITDQNVYVFNMSEKSFSRAIKKAINCNLAACSEIIPLEEYYADPEE